MTFDLTRCVCKDEKFRCNWCLKMFWLGSKWKARFSAAISCRICVAGRGISDGVVVLSVRYLESQCCSQAAGINCPEYFSLRMWRQIFRAGLVQSCPFSTMQGKKNPITAFLLHTRGPMSAVLVLSPVDWKILVTVSRVGGITLFECQSLSGSEGKGCQCIRRWGGLARQREEQWHFSDSYQLICVKSSEMRVLPFQHSF